MTEHPQTCRLTWLVPGAGPEYDRLHHNAPPEIRERLTASGVSDYSIFRYGDLVLNVLRRDPAGTVPTFHQEVQREWTATLAPLFATTQDARGENIWAERVFRLD